MKNPLNKFKQDWQDSVKMHYDLPLFVNWRISRIMEVGFEDESTIIVHFKKM